jgi:hypothetical protein
MFTTLVFLLLRKFTALYLLLTQLHKHYGYRISVN